jgi:hypothetical protein
MGAQDAASDPPEDLPAFVDWETLNFFSLPRSGDDARDLSIGTWAAEQALAFARRHRNYEILPLCIASIIAGGQCESLEAGFIRRLAAAAYAGNLN